MLDCLVGLLMASVGALYAKLTTPYILAYLAMPTGLYGLHILGAYLQEAGRGSEWVQWHLHNVGISSLALLIVFFVAGIANLRRHDFSLFARKKAMGEQIMRMTPRWIGLATVIAMIAELIMVLLFGDRSRTAGYSGEVDLGDMFAYLAGFGLVVINHVVMCSYVRRKAFW